MEEDKDVDESANGEGGNEEAPEPQQTDDGRSRKGAGRPKGTVGAAPKKSPFENKDAELIWPEIISKLPKMGHNVYELVIRVIRVEPPPREQIGKAFEASAVRGDGGSQIPGDALIAFVTQYYHVPFQQGPAQYELQWVWKSTGHIFAHGTLRLPSRDMISAGYAAEWRMRQEQGLGSLAPGMGGMPPPPDAWRPPLPSQSFGAAQPGQQQAPPGQPWQFQYPPYYGMPPQPQRDPEIDQLKTEMREIKELLRGLGRPESAPTPPAAAPAPPVSLDVQIARGVVQALAAMGIVPKHDAGTGVGTPQAPPAVPLGPVQQAAAGLDALEALAGIFTRTRKVTRTLEGVMGREDDDDEDEEDEREKAGDDEKEAPGLGVALVDVGTTWRDGRPVKAAVDPETGKFVFDQQGLMGIALGNPIIGEGVMDFIKALKQKMVAGPVGVAGGPGVNRNIQVRPVLQQEPQQEPPPSPQQGTSEQTSSGQTPWVV